MTLTRPDLLLHIDSTMRSCFASCPQKFNLEFAHGYRPVGVSIDLHAGACFALAIETTYNEIHVKGKDIHDALTASHVAFALAWGQFEIPSYKKTAKTFDRVWEAVESYFGNYPPLTDHVQPYFAADGKPTFEYTFAIPLEPACDPRDLTPEGKDWRAESLGLMWPLHPSGEPFLYSGRFDMLGSYAGRPCVRDEKTTGGSIGQYWAESWDLRAQFLGYVWACQQAGLDLDTVIVRGIAIQKTQIVHAEAIKTYNAFMVNRWHEQLRRDLWRLRRAWDEGYFDFNLGESCTAYGGCVFKDVCQSPQPEAWLSNFEIRHWNPLVKNPVKETV